ncbi:hypothetical protein GJ496_003906 [Pomphorhynchus laevis]|nr:hypothetical protein GJ496_003906 [Pomphorhynchus laevis]
MPEIVSMKESNVRSLEIVDVDKTISFSHAQRPVSQCPVCRLKFRITDASFLFKHGHPTHCAGSEISPTSQRSSHSQSTDGFSQQPQAPMCSKNTAKSEQSCSHNTARSKRRLMSRFNR